MIETVKGPVFFWGDRQKADKYIMKLQTVMSAIREIKQPERHEGVEDTVFDKGLKEDLFGEGRPEQRPGGSERGSRVASGEAHSCRGNSSCSCRGLRETAEVTVLAYQIWMSSECKDLPRCDSYWPLDSLTTSKEVRATERQVLNLTFPEVLGSYL